MNYFKDCRTLEDAKKIYHKLAFELHPDQGGTNDSFKELQKQYEAFLSGVWNSAFNAYAKERGFTPKANVSAFESVLKEAVHLANDKYLVQIIGYWIYVFNGYEIKSDLMKLGFWYSKKHRAWIYSGMKKINHATRMPLYEIKQVYGCATVEEEEGTTKRIGRN